MRLKEAEQSQAGGQAYDQWLEQLVSSGHIDTNEARRLSSWHQAIYHVISVDQFEKNQLSG